MNSIFVLVGVMMGLIVYALLVRPLASATCLVDTINCLTLEYQVVGNTALIRDPSSGRHVWFVGDDVLLYGEPTGRICRDGHEPAYVWNLSLGKSKGYICSSQVDDIRERYYSNAPVHRLNIKTLGTLDMYGMVNALIDNQVISFPNIESV